MRLWSGASEEAARLGGENKVHINFSALHWPPYCSPALKLPLRHEGLQTHAAALLQRLPMPQDLPRSPLGLPTQQVTPGPAQSAAVEKYRRALRGQVTRNTHWIVGVQQWVHTIKRLLTSVAGGRGWLSCHPLSPLPPGRCDLADFHARLTKRGEY